MSRKYLFRASYCACLILACASPPLIAAPSLDGFMQQVWEQHPAIAAANHAIEATKAGQLAASQPLYNPEVDVDVERTDINTFSVGVNQTLDWRDKRSVQSQLATTEIKVAQAELSALRQQLATEVLSALINLSATQNHQTLATQRVSLMQQLLSNTEQRQQAGDIGLQDVALVRVAHSEALMQVANLQAEQAQQLAILQSTSGLISPQWPTLPQTSPIAPKSPNFDVMLNHLPQLLILNAQHQSAKAKVSLAKTQRQADPSVGLRGGLDDNNALIGLSFSMPLFVRNRFRAEVVVANEQALQIEQTLLNRRRQALAHLQGAYQRYQITAEAWQTWQTTGLSSLNEQLQLIQQIWQAGEMSAAEYLIQAKQNVDAQTTAATLLAKMWTSWIEWLSASGQVETWLTQAK